MLRNEYVREIEKGRRGKGKAAERKRGDIAD